MIKQIAAAAVLALAAIAAYATDEGKEERWAAQVEANLFEGEMAWLEADGHRFLGVLTEADDPRGNVVVVHGTGVHPDWGQVINPLRVGLAERGWTTLSIQMPVLGNEVPPEEYQSVFPEAPPRLAAAAAWFDGDAPVFLAAHSLGAAMSAYTLSNADTSPYAGFVAIGMSGEAAFPEADNVESLKSISLPVLDLYGEADFDSVLNTTSERAAAQSGNPNYTQQMVPGANHFFDGHDAALVEAVAAWLDGRGNR